MEGTVNVQLRFIEEPATCVLDYGMIPIWFEVNQRDRKPQKSAPFFGLQSSHGRDARVTNENGDRAGVSPPSVVIVMAVSSREDAFDTTRRTRALPRRG